MFRTCIECLKLVLVGTHLVKVEGVSGMLGYIESTGRVCYASCAINPKTFFMLVFIGSVNRTEPLSLSSE